MPNYYMSQEDCAQHFSSRTNTNPRYKHFKQIHYTAGDFEQFFNVQPTHIRKDGLSKQYIYNTFYYMFYQCKKGIYIKIRNNTIDIFLPFSNAHFTNRWGHRLKPDMDMVRYIRTHHAKEVDNLNDIHVILWYCQYNENRPFLKKRVEKFLNKWYSNNGIIRYEHPIPEGDSGVAHIHDMFLELCNTRKVKDVDIFVNRRDFPIHSKQHYEPYHHIFGDRTPLPSFLTFDDMCPILSMVSNEKYNDISIPTWEDWARVSSIEDGKYFPKANRDYTCVFDIPWKKKKTMAVFRGASTGMETTQNMRLFVCELSHPNIDAKISHLNCRPRIHHVDGQPTLTCMKSIFHLKGNFLTPYEQSSYKYIIHVDGHTASYRIGYEMGMGSVLLKFKSPYTMWCSNYLVAYDKTNIKNANYISIKEDGSDLVGWVEWCTKHDDECSIIAQNAKKTYDLYFNKNHILDRLNQTLSTLYHCNDEVRKLPIQKEISTLPTLTHKLYTNSNCEIWATTDTQMICKKKLRGSKEDFLYSGFIGKYCLNYFPYFATTFRYNKNYIVMQKIQGISFYDWIHSKQFSYKEYIKILLQLQYILHICQHKVGFVHYDLTTWNVMLQKNGKQKITYPISDTSTVSLYAKYKPIIIDYANVSGVCKDYYYSAFHHCKLPTFQDSLTILINSSYDIKNHSALHFICNTEYTNHTCICRKNTKSFLYDKKKYNELLHGNKAGVQQYTPLQFADYLVQTFNVYIQKEGEFKPSSYVQDIIEKTLTWYTTPH